MPIEDLYKIRWLCADVPLMAPMSRIYFDYYTDTENAIIGIFKNDNAPTFYLRSFSHSGNVDSQIAIPEDSAAIDIVCNHVNEAYRRIMSTSEGYKALKYCMELGFAEITFFRSGGIFLHLPEIQPNIAQQKQMANRSNFPSPN